MLTVEEIIATVGPILKRYSITDAILFGSCAKGCATEQSDVDSYVDSGLRGIHFYELLGEVCGAFPVSVDLLISA